MIICPGGAYSHCSDREGEPVALRFMSLGWAAGVLTYSTSPARYPVALNQLAETVKYIRNHCTKYNAHPHRIVVMGFSAGGHLAACLGNMWHDWGEDCRPNALVLCYPVITSGDYAHVRSFMNLLGNQYEELKDDLSMEKKVSLLTPPTFVWHTRTDEGVACMNSLLFADQLQKFGIKHHLELFETGEHGLSLANREVLSQKHPAVNNEVAQWPELADNWLRKIFEK